ncbi:PD-(D/E)XK nuclease family protein [Streptomyces cremeus]|uniref:PD-(D/E)XK nuclease family protein n=1 Tax=Streptomyces cremeus TaxID=66881 RepID=A0ABV5P5B2_STRCM
MPTEEPPGLTGDPGYARFAPRHVSRVELSCPDQVRSDVRPLVQPVRPAPFATGPLQRFAALPLTGCLDLVEFDGRSQEESAAELRSAQGRLTSWWARSHPTHIEWTQQQLGSFLAARTAEQEEATAAGLPATLPVRDHWVRRTARRPQPDARGFSQYEHTVPGRRYASACGRLRDVWLVSTSCSDVERGDAEKAAMAWVAAEGAPSAKPRWNKASPPTESKASVAPERVRVFAYGCRDASYRQVLDWDAETCARRFAAHALPAFEQAAGTSGTRPGGSCVDCKSAGACGSLPLAPQLWGGTAPAARRPRMSLSAWDLRVYEQCPARYHLTRTLRLGSRQPESEATRRGRAVDAWLNSAHEARRPEGCRHAPLPRDPEHWTGGEHALSGQSARDGAAMLDQHRSVCPLDRLPAQERVLTQHQVSAYAPEIDVVVIATPDLLYTRSGGWWWRETKTSATGLWEGRSLMSAYPQLALGVLLLSAGVLGGELRRSRVEFELLGTGDSTLERLDPGRPAVVEEAREVIAALAQPLLHDTTYAASPGRSCLDCEVRPWCAEGAVGPVTTSAATPVTTPQEASLAH